MSSLKAPKHPRNSKMHHKTNERARSQRKARGALKKGERSQKPWKSEDTKYLHQKWGVVSLGAIAQRLGRTVDGVRQRARLLKLGSPIRGLTTLTQAAAKLGWTRATILLAADACDIKRTYGVTTTGARTGRRLVYEDHELERISEYLTKKRMKVPFGTRVHGVFVPFVSKSSVKAPCGDCGQKRVLVSYDLCSACNNRAKRKALRWGKNGVSDACAECDSRDFAPFTKTRCTDCQNARNRDAYHAKKRAA